MIWAPYCSVRRVTTSEDICTKLLPAGRPIPSFPESLERATPYARLIGAVLNFELSAKNRLFREEIGRFFSRQAGAPRGEGQAAEAAAPGEL